MLVIYESDSRVEKPPLHGAIGMSMAYQISDATPAPRAMEFRKRVLHADGQAAYPCASSAKRRWR